MPFDLFISYSRSDNRQGSVEALILQIQSSFSAFAGRPLRVFFDQSQIRGMDEWRQKIQQSLRESHLFLAVLSPDYLSSPFCRWEWEDYVRYEAMRQCLGEGMAPIYFMTLGEIDESDPAMVSWITDIRRRQTFNLQPWHEQGEKALQDLHVKNTLEQLHSAVRERLSRSERARQSPNNLIRHNPAFVGRIRELTILREALIRNALGVVGARSGSPPGAVAVQGLGGMGKTELALAYAHAFAWDYPGGRWHVSCEFVDDLRMALGRLAGPLHVKFSEEEKKDSELQFERILVELQNRERSLLILDNVSEPSLLEPVHLDRLPRNGHVDLIVTTRLPASSIPGSAVDMSFVAVDEMPEEDALALLRSHQPRGCFLSSTEEIEARNIVRLLRGFTLAVETAAIYLGRHPEPDACRRFRERLSPSLIQESEQAATDPSVAVRHRIRSLEETLACTLDTLTPEARNLLCYAALLPADQVAVPWLQTLAGESGFHYSVNLLLGLRLFVQPGSVGSEERPLVVRMHRLIQELFIRKNLFVEMESRTGDIVKHLQSRAHFLLEGWASSGQNWEVAPLAAAAELMFEKGLPEAVEVVVQASEPLAAMGHFVEARRLLNRVVANPSTALLSNQRLYVAMAFAHLAMVERAMGHLQEARTLSRKALTLGEQADDPWHPVLAVFHSNMALVEQDLLEAKRHLQKAMEIETHAFGPDYPMLAVRLANLAQVEADLGNTSEASSLLHRAISIEEASGNRPRLAAHLSTLGLIEQQTGHLEAAEILFARSVAIRLDVFGPHNPDTANALVNQARLHMEMGKIQEAESLANRARDIWSQSEAPGDPRLGKVFWVLGSVASSRKEWKIAHERLKESLRLLRMLHRDGHPWIVAIGNELARIPAPSESKHEERS